MIVTIMIIPDALSFQNQSRRFLLKRELGPSGRRQKFKGTYDLDEFVAEPGAEALDGVVEPAVDLALE